ncbi:MAG: hypothetical protein IKX43_04330, partial [Paludibacteraceae bacterium]|nr:hypothetical protein [Paludibacteraceae bacterium]
ETGSNCCNIAATFSGRPRFSRTSRKRRQNKSKNQSLTQFSLHNLSEVKLVFSETDYASFEQVARHYRYEYDDALHYAGHGVHFGQFTSDANGAIASCVMIKELNQETKHDIIVLHSCQTGKEDCQYSLSEFFSIGVPLQFIPTSSYANYLSRQMPDKYIVAPSEDIIFVPSLNEDCEVNEQFADEKVDKNGTWNVWRNGEVITKFSGDVIPTSDVVRHYIDVATNHSVNENHGDE